MYMTPAVNAEEYYLELGATQTGNVEEAYDDIIVGEAATNVQVQTASNGYSYKGSTKGQLATTEFEKLQKALRAEILRARRMRLFMLTVIMVTFLIAVAALILVIMKIADGEGSAAPKQETTTQGECPTNSHTCDVNAVCQNTAGSHTCLCKLGYTGDGTTCYDLDECTSNSHTCDVNAVCYNTAGSHKCSCKAGYSGDGKTCHDIDECSNNAHCFDVNAVCTNAQGSYSCACKAKYTGNGTKCVLAVTFRAVFTNLGASGRLHPTSLGSYYRGQDHDGQVTLHSGIQRWTVPYTGDYRIEAIGAAGGYDKSSNGGIFRGRGARMEGTFNLSQGETIQILVGQEGGINNVTNSAGGGGGTFVVNGSNTPLIVAGGGGGVNYSNTRYTGCDATTATTGRTGHLSLAGGSGGQGAQVGQSTNLGGGGGGFYTSGRSSTQFGGSMGTGGEGGGGFIQGGIGGRSWLNNVVGGFGGGGGAYGSGGGGGGGGGYSGDGSGKGLQEACGGGGGSYNAGKNQQNECCYNAAGHGQVTITLI